MPQTPKQNGDGTNGENFHVEIKTVVEKIRAKTSLSDHKTERDSLLSVKRKGSKHDKER